MLTELGRNLYIHHVSGRTETVSIPTGKHCTNYRAEVEAILQAIKYIEDSEELSTNVVILTDALSVIQAFENSKLPAISRALHHLSHQRNVCLQWIPAHCGIPGNERADSLAKQGATGIQPVNKITHEEQATVIKTMMKPKANKDAYHLLDRWEQVIIMRLRTGHNRLNAHMYNKLKLSHSPMCPCGLEQQTAEHILQRCPHLEDTKKSVWPQPKPLPTKLHGGIEDLRNTASFIVRSGVTV